MSFHRFSDRLYSNICNLFKDMLFIHYVSDLASGSSMDWAKATAGVKYSYTIELRPNTRQPHFAVSFQVNTINYFFHFFSISIIGEHLDGTEREVNGSTIVICINGSSKNYWLSNSYESGIKPH